MNSLTWLFPLTMREDCVSLALATIVPVAAGIAVGKLASNDDADTKWWLRERKPKWCTFDDDTYTLVDTIVVAPLGLASFLVHKHGGGFTNRDTAIALGCYGATFAVGMLFIPAMRMRSHRLNTYLSALGCAASASTAYLFYKMHPLAGALFVPHAVCMAFYTVLNGSMASLNDDDEKS